MLTWLLSTWSAWLEKKRSCLVLGSKPMKSVKPRSDARILVFSAESPSSLPLMRQERGTKDSRWRFEEECGELQQRDTGIREQYQQQHH